MSQQYNLLAATQRVAVSRTVASNESRVLHEDPISLTYQQAGASRRPRLRRTLQYAALLVAVGVTGWFVLPRLFQQHERLQAQTVLSEGTTLVAGTVAATGTPGADDTTAVAAPPEVALYQRWAGFPNGARRAITYTGVRTATNSGEGDFRRRLLIVAVEPWGKHDRSVLVIRSSVFELGTWSMAPTLIDSSFDHLYLPTYPDQLIVLAGHDVIGSKSDFEFLVEGSTKGRGIEHWLVMGRLMGSDTIAFSTVAPADAAPTPQRSAKIGVDDLHADTRPSRP